MKRNDPSDYFSPEKHLDWCKKESHHTCWFNCSHARIMLEAICRLVWCFFHTQPTFVNIKTKPKLADAMYYIFSNKIEFVDKEYEWIMGVKDSLKQLLPEYHGYKKV